VHQREGVALKRFLLLTFSAGLLLLILGCSSVATESKKVDVLTIADSTGDWGYPSPYGHYARGPCYIRMSLIFDTLIWKDESGFVPALAEKWEYLPDEKAYVFHLRKGVTWNDGEPFTARDVAFTFDYIKKHPYQWVDSSIVSNAEAVDSAGAHLQRCDRSHKFQRPQSGYRNRTV
jgi:peptide/nickel transport system substrate-binding protein